MTKIHEFKKKQPQTQPIYGTNLRIYVYGVVEWKVQIHSACTSTEVYDWHFLKVKKKKQKTNKRER